MSVRRADLQAVRGFDPRRLAEIIVVDQQRPGRRGSGYRITSKSVLTAAHVVAGAQAVSVRFDSDLCSEWTVAAAIAWCDEHADLAVLTIEPPAGRAEVSRVRYGRLGGRVPFVDVHAAGFPLWKLRKNDPYQAGSKDIFRFRELHHAQGQIAVASNRRTGRLEVRVSAPGKSPFPDMSPWEGMSGAVVWAGDYVIGIISEHHRSEGSDWLTAVRIDRCLQVAGNSRWRLAQLMGINSHVVRLPDVSAVDMTTRNSTAAPRSIQPYHSPAILNPNQSQIAMTLIRSADYRNAALRFKENIAMFPDGAANYYYLGLATLGGLDPADLSISTIQQVNGYLIKSVQLDQRCHQAKILALLVEDAIFLRRRRRSRTLIRENESLIRRIPVECAREIVSHVRVPGSNIWKALSQRIEESHQQSEA